MIEPRRPTCSAATAAARLRASFDLEGRLQVLPGEREVNFRVESADGRRFVLKVASHDLPRDLIDFQHRMLDRLAGRLDPCAVPSVVPDLAGHELVEALDDDGQPCRFRLLTWIDGRPLVEVKPHSPELLAEIGATMAQIDLGLAGFEHPTGERFLDWDLCRAQEVLGQRSESVREPKRRALVERIADRFSSFVAARLTDLDRVIIHNDGNDHNFLVKTLEGRLRIAGLIDFGDAVKSVRVAEPAIAAAYAALGKSQPLRAATAVIAGYHQVAPLSALELEICFDLILTRLAVSVATAAWRTGSGLDDPYFSVSEAGAWQALELLAAESPAWVTANLRSACGLPASSKAAAVKAFFLRHEAAPMIDFDLSKNCIPLDLSIGSADWAEIEQSFAPASTSKIRSTKTLPESLRAEGLTALVERALDHSGAQVALGRWNEARAFYRAPQFALPTDPGAGVPAMRTVHLGVDLFQKAGISIFAPFAGEIASFADNDQPGDYGPTLILRHTLPESGEEFFTLYGHLSRRSLDGKAIGQKIAAGELLGTLGDVDVNGGWAPHLHFQVLLETFGRQGDFPGVADPEARRLWLELCPDPSPILGIDASAPTPEPAELAERRSHLLGKNLSLSYRAPLHIVRGRGPYLFDAAGRAFLDTVNNVAHVGHCHPHVDQAARRQGALLCTNTRYLHDEILRYAERLQAKLPNPLSVCFFVCSGSEANDLAWRMARAATGGDQWLVVDGAYHGHTEVLIDLSPYKFAGPGGAGRRPWVHQVDLPDPLRGPAHGSAQVEEICGDLVRAGHKPAAFFCESILSCGGQIELPTGFLFRAANAVRAAGGLYVADEVQTGFGRVGKHFWAFEAHGVVPDIVTMGKPIGNGYPLAALVTTPEIAAAFANGMEYFNTFGGNPVACAVGNAVLDVIEGESLQERAAQLGSWLKESLRSLQGRFPLIADVRGQGLFLGIELVRDPESLAPAVEQAKYLVERMKDHGILMSIDGPRHNVLKIKPPLVIDQSDLEMLVSTLSQVLAEDLAQPA